MNMYELLGDKIYFHLSPSEFLGMETMYIMVVTMSCGGGMGGSKWNEFILPIELKTEELMEVTTIDGDKITINTRFVVKVEKKQLVIVELVHQNKHFNNMGVPYKNGYVTSLDNEVSFVRSYYSDKKWCSSY